VIDHGSVIADGTSDELKSRVGGERLEVQLDEGRERGRRARGARGHVREPSPASGGS
jgi:ABC-2 type transport system ATP-binding protein